jgi:hypothetical protein
MSEGLALSFQPFQVPIQFILGNAFPTFQFLDAPVNFRVDGLAVGPEPFILLVEHLQRAIDHLIRTPADAVSVKRYRALFKDA